MGNTGERLPLVDEMAPGQIWQRLSFKQEAISRIMHSVDGQEA